MTHLPCRQDLHDQLTRGSLSRVAYCDIMWFSSTPCFRAMVAGLPFAVVWPKAAVRYATSTDYMSFASYARTQLSRLLGPLIVVSHTDEGIGDVPPFPRFRVGGRIMYIV